MKTTKELVFIETTAGKESHRTYPIGTPVTEPTPSDAGDELVTCKDRAEKLTKAGEDHTVMILDGRPRILLCSTFR